jgi:glycosyltransferase involved in cell wall biosynthesis
MSEKRILMISPIFPAETGSGLAMRMAVFLEALAGLAKVEVIVVPVAGNTASFAEPSYMSRLAVRVHVAQLSGMTDTHFKLISQISDPWLRLSAFKHYGKPSFTNTLSSPVRSYIEKIIDAFSPHLVHIGRSYLSPLVENAGSRVATLDLDEDDLSSFNSSARVAAASGKDYKAVWLRQEGLACDSQVAIFGPRFQKIFVASHRERVQLGLRHPELKFDVAKNAIQIPAHDFHRDDGATFLFIGSLSYPPNYEGISWFIEKVMPRLYVRGSRLRGRLLIAGTNAPPVLRSFGRLPRVDLVGCVESTDLLYRQATIALGPMWSGGGTRIKLLEAAAFGVASVATEVAAEGLDLPHCVGGWRAINLVDFVDACSQALIEPAERLRRARLGRLWVSKHHSREQVIGGIRAEIRQLL